ncbi:MAG: FKBP-type peptidyl-prolyl cis-trans isomerase [Rhodanobacteraceae bacterium]|nr:FKBP-type peptidyl-prolyl cis-trans isomerase [Rhodanobacteraceae bacterium]
MLTAHRLFVAVAVALLAACRGGGNAAPAASSPVPAARSELTTDRERASYMVGLDLAKNVAPVKDEVDIELVVQALRDAHAGKPALLDPAQTDAVRKQFTQSLRDKRDQAQAAQAAENRDRGAAFLADNAKQAGVAVTASGLQYHVLRAADGPRPQASDTVRLNYIGSLLDGQVFEDTYAIDHPASFALNQVMPGLQEAIQLMPVGAKYRFWLPASLAYAERGVPGQIGPNATLVFELELLEIAGRQDARAAAAQ